MVRQATRDSETAIARASLDRSIDLERAHLAAIVESSEDAIISKSLDGIIRSWNDAARRMFGYSAVEAIGQSVTMLIPPSRQDDESEILRSLRQGQKIKSYETLRRGRDGREFDVSLSVSPVRNSAGEIVGAAKIVRDISEQKRFEAAARLQQMELEHLSRVDTTGKIAASLSHELKQPLAAILNFATASLKMIQEQNATTVEVAPAIVAIVDQSRRAGEIVRRVQAFIRKGEIRREPVGLKPLVTDALGLLDSELRTGGIVIGLEMDDALPKVIADAVQVEQVMVNLIRNAVEAMTSPGARGKTLRVRSQLQNRQVCMEVIDQGCGITPDAARRTFEPFYTSKPDGLGMGLAISRSIVEESGGKQSAAVNSDGGMTLSFTLPVAGQSV
jgi:PAS domain S-box-containing protein